MEQAAASSIGAEIMGMRRRQTIEWIAAMAVFFAASAFAAESRAGWPLGQPAQGHAHASYRGYWVAPTYSYMPSAFPYGSFGAQSNLPRVVHYDYYNNLRTWGPWPGH
jgi:hypothetical protein